MVTCKERVEQSLRRIEETKDLNIMLFVDKEGALQRAEELDKNLTGKLAGKIIVFKPNISVIGWPVSCGSKTLENYKGTFDADVVTRLREEGAILLGYVNCDEFACGVSGETSAFGPTKNPVVPERIPGGSSSGSAAAIAAGICDISLGSETGGSIRNPASHCGVIGIKPSYGAVSRYGLVDLSMSLDQIGPLARSLDDMEVLLDVIMGASPFDPTSEDFNNSAKDEITFGWSLEIENLCDPQLAARVKEVAEKFNPVEVSLPNVHLAVQTYYPIVYNEFYSGTRKFDGKKYGRRIEEAAGPEVLRRILGGRIISEAEHAGQYYRKALAAKHVITKDVEAVFNTVDIILSPVTPRLPHKFTDKLTPKECYAMDACTIPANLAGCCAASFPAGTIDGIPFGIQLMAKRGHEATLLKALRQLERVC